MLQLNNLDKTNKDRKRVGRGGDLGGTSGRGHKGQKSRSGASIRPSFEGGQMSLSRRLPKRGFNNPFAKKVTIISLVDLEKKFDAESTVDREALVSVGLIKGRKIGTVKILGNTPLTKKLTVIADAFSKGAVQEIEKAGGQVTVLKENERGSDAL